MVDNVEISRRHVADGFHDTIPAICDQLVGADIGNGGGRERGWGGGEISKKQQIYSYFHSHSQSTNSFASYDNKIENANQQMMKRKRKRQS